MNQKAVLDAINRALNCCDRGQTSEAVRIVSDLPSPLMDDREVRTRFGHLCMTLRNFSAALPVFEDLNERFPATPDYLYYLGEANRELGRGDAARSYLDQCLELDPDHWKCLAAMADLSIASADYEEARVCLEKALSLKPGSVAINTNMSSCMLKLGRHEECISYAQKALKQDGGNTHALNTLAYALSELGREEEAAGYFQKALKLDRKYGPAWLNYSRIKKYSEEDLPAIKKTERLLRESMPSENRRVLHFALGKMYDDCRLYQQAYEHFSRANTLGKSVYQEKPIPDKLLDIERQYFTRERLQCLSQELGNNSRQPVFVVGMPRSGTTLIEQMIASHPLAMAAGELTKMGQINDAICPLGSYRDFRARWDEKTRPEVFMQFAKEYLAQLCSGRESAARIVDKMPENFHYLGLIHILFPGARIIHVRRNPLDTCLSCFFQSFTSVAWSYDLEWIAGRYRNYLKTMELWSQVLPRDVLLHIQYEEMVAEPEAHIRKIIDHIELDWDPRCLDYHRGGTPVKTASVWQVRQPVYRSSIKRWQNYRDNIEELARLLWDLLEESDLQLLREAGIKPVQKSWWRRLLN